jgi:hypothetical protein
MKKLIYFALGSAIILTTACSNDDEDPILDPGESTTELLVKKFTAPPTMDGEIDAMWSTAQKLTGTTEVPNLAARGTFLNSDGEGVEEELGLFFPFSGDKYPFTIRSGYSGDNIYFLIEWSDADDSKDRQSWYFDSSDKRWKGEHKYANAANDKFYEDKFAFLFPIGEVDGFSASTCYATCHQNLTIVKDKDKHTRHYLLTEGQKVDMWHWKRVRGAYADQVDDQKIVYDDASKQSSCNGRKGDTNGEAGYSNNSQTLNNGVADVSVPKYIIPDATDTYWIGEDDISAGTAKLVTAVDANGVLTYAGGTIDPTGDNAYAQGTGIKRFPSVILKPFTGARADIEVKAVYTGNGWITEVKRKLNTGDPDDVVFNPAEELPFGFATFDNSAIAHAIKPNLTMKFEQ